VYALAPAVLSALVSIVRFFVLKLVFLEIPLAVLVVAVAVVLAFAPALAPVVVPLCVVSLATYPGAVNSKLWVRLFCTLMDL